MAMDDSDGIVIVGASLAGASAAETLRDRGFGGRLVLVGDEAELPYERPPLSKDYLQGKAERDRIYVHPEQWYAERDIELALGVRADAIDTRARRIGLADGSELGYSKLLLTTGSSPRRFLVPGSELDGVLSLRTVRDSERIKGALRPGARVVIIGAGWIGLEVAAAARLAGAEVTVVEVAELPLLRVLGREIAAIFAELHHRHGVDLRFGAEVEEIVGREGKVAAVRIARQGSVEADVVVVGIGIVPNVELAKAAGLHVDNGVVVDDHLRTSDPDVYAAGDVANAFHPLFGRHIRVEHWANALNQPRTAATNMVGGGEVYDRVPYFFTDQYELGMEYSGYVEPDGYDEVVIRGDGETEFIAFWLREGRVLAGMNVNVWDVTEDIQGLVRAKRPVDPAELADADRPLSRLVRNT
jgi:3-phenylpropionate/trans-cinnamate dioxygenase ferredoxin reductase subunit